MSQQDLLNKVLQTLSDLGIDYMVTGSIASSLHGEPRATHDIDLVVNIDHSHVSELINAFLPPAYFLDEQAVHSAIDSGGMFSLVEVAEGDKVDFWLLTDNEFDTSRFARKYPEDVLGIEIIVSSPEDTVLVKLSWVAQAGGSEKHYLDALRVYEVQAGIIDHEYMNQWAARLGVEDLWQRLRSEAEIL